MDLKEFDFEKLTKQQKMMIPLGAVLALVVIWQVFVMFSGDDTSQQQGQESAEVAPGNSGAPGEDGDDMFAEDAGGFPGEPNESSASNLQQIMVSEVQEIKPLPPTQAELQELENAKQMRKVYLTLLQQYQIATVQRLLAETRASIATSEASLSQQNLEKLRTNNQADQLEGGAATFTPGPGGELVPNYTGAGTETADTDVGPSDKFTLHFIGQHRGRWSAIIMVDSKHYDVQVGSRLPDESEVMSINSESVLIAKNMKRLLLRLPATSQDMFVEPQANKKSASDAAGAAGAAGDTGDSVDIPSL